MYKEKNLIMAGFHGNWKLNSYGSFTFTEEQKKLTKKHVSERALKSEDFLSRQNETEFHLNPDSKDYKKLDFCRKYISELTEVVDVSAAPALFQKYAIQEGFLNKDRVICTEFSADFVGDLNGSIELDWRVLDLADAASQSLFFENLTKKINLWIFWYSIYYSGDPNKLFSELSLKSANGSKIIIASPKPTIGTVLNFGKEKFHPTYFISRRELISIANQNNFQLVSEHETKPVSSIRPNKNSKRIRFLARFLIDLIIHSLILLINKAMFWRVSDTFKLKSSDMILVFEHVEK